MIIVSALSQRKRVERERELDKSAQISKKRPYTAFCRKYRPRYKLCSGKFARGAYCVAGCLLRSIVLSPIVNKYIVTY